METVTCLVRHRKLLRPEFQVLRRAFLITGRPRERRTAGGETRYGAQASMASRRSAASRFSGRDSAAAVPRTSGAGHKFRKFAFNCSRLKEVTTDDR